MFGEIQIIFGIFRFNCCKRRLPRISHRCWLNLPHYFSK